MSGRDIADSADAETNGRSGIHNKVVQSESLLSLLFIIGKNLNIVELREAACLV
jgi:hypothetical protein